MQSGKSLVPRAQALLLASFFLATIGPTTGCGGMIRAAARTDSAPHFEDGALRALEEHEISALDEACARAVETLEYAVIESARAPEQVHWRAATAGGDPVDIRLTAKRRGRTEVVIRIGPYGDEARSRLVLEQIRLSL